MNYDSPISEIESTAEDFQLIRDFIHEKSGVFFSESRMHLVRDRLAKRMQDVQVKSLRDYYYHVKYDTSLREFQQLMNLVTTNETGFFRNQPQLQSFSSEVLPQFLDLRTKNKEPKVLRVWSAGCSTGEEPYSLAILLLDMLQDKPGWSCEIFANDISEEVLTMARIGEYSGATLSNVSADHMARYFTMTSEGARVNQEVKALVRFSHLNLNDPRKCALFTGMDAIFCRNVMVYFSDQVKKRLVRCFYNALRPGGFLFVGQTETLHGFSRSFRLNYFKDALVYQKATESAPSDSNTHSTANPSANTGDSVSSSPIASRARNMLSTVRTGLPPSSDVIGR